MKRGCLPNVHPRPHQSLLTYTSIAISAVMTRRGRSICTSTEMAKSPALNSCLLFISLSFLSLACSSRAPKDYYFEFTLMEEWGEHNRRRTGREPHQVVSHPEKTEPLAIAFEVGNAPAQLLGFEPYEIPEPQPADQPPPLILSKVPISLQQDVLRRVFQEQEIHATHWRLKDGRLDGKQNVVQVHFIPRALSDRAIKEEFLMVCAIVHGAQLEKDTIDVVRGIAESEDGTPQMTLETQITDYRAYIQERINLQQWESQLRLKRF